MSKNLEFTPFEKMLLGVFLSKAIEEIPEEWWQGNKPVAEGMRKKIIEYMACNQEELLDSKLEMEIREALHTKK